MPEGIEWSIEFYGHGVRPCLTPLDHPALEAVTRAMATAFGTEVLYTREGGSGPEADLQDVLEAPVVFLGVSLPDDGWHAPNEKVEIPLLLKGAEAAAHLWDDLADGAAPRDRPRPAARPGRWRARRVDRAAEHRTDEAWLAAAWSSPQRAGRAHVARARPQWSATHLRSPSTSSATWAVDRGFFLGVDGDRPFFAVELDAERRPTSRSAACARSGCCSAPATPVCSCTRSRWRTGTRPTRTARAAVPDRVATAGHIRVCAVDGSEHYPRTDPAVIMVGRRRGRPAAARPAVGLAGGPVLDPGRLRRAGGVARAGRAPRGRRGGRRRDRRGRLPRQPAVAVPVEPDARLRRARDDGGDRRRRRRDRRGALVHRDGLRDDVDHGRVLLSPSVSIARRLIEHWYGEPITDSVDAWR